MNDMIGYLRLGFKGDTKQLDKDIKEAEKKLREYDKEKEALLNKKSKLQEQESSLEIEIKHYDRLIEKSNELKDTISKTNSELTRMKEERASSYQQYTKAKELGEQEKELERINEQLKKEESANAKIVDKYEQVKFSINNINKQLLSVDENQKNYTAHVEELKSKQQITHLGFNNFTKDAKKGFNTMVKGAKKLALGIIGAYSAYSLVRRAANAYMSTDEKLSKQMQANWVALGTILEPIIKWIMELVKKAVTGILYFMSILSGGKVDYIKKANEMIIKNQKKQKQTTDELRKSTEKFTASFDELNMVQDNASKIDTNDTLDTSVLFNVNDLSENTRKAIEKIAKALQPVYNFIKDIIKWATEHPDVILAILGGALLLSTIGKIIGSATALSGLLGISTLLAGLMAIGVITIGISIAYLKLTADQIYEDQKKLMQGQKSALDTTKQEQEKIRKNATGLEKNSKATNNLVSSIQDYIKTEKNQQKAVKQNIQSMSKAEREAANFSGSLQAMYYNYAISISKEWEYIKTQEELAKQGKLTDDQMVNYLATLSAFDKKISGTSEESKFLREAFQFIGEDTKKLKEIQLGSTTIMENYGMKTTLAKKSVDAFDTATKNAKDTLNELPKEKEIKFKTNANKTKEEIDELSGGVKKVPQSKTITIDITSKEFKEKLNNIKEKISEVINKNYVVKVGILTAGEMFGIDSSTMNNLLKKLFPNSKIKNAATGGIHIVNNPGRGVVSGNVKRGEAGAEGIIPLTDESALEELGASIGKHVVIYTTMINQINGRTLSKEVKEIMAQSNFASNG